MENKSVLCGSINNKSWGDITVAKNSVDDFIKDAEGTNIFSVAMFDVFDEE